MENNQENTQSQEQKNFVGNPTQDSTMGKVISTGLKVEGWDYRARVIKNLAIALLLIVISIYLFYTYLTSQAPQTQTLELAGALLLIGILLILSAWFYWWRSKSLVRGKFYAPKNTQN